MRNEGNPGNYHLLAIVGIVGLVVHDELVVDKVETVGTGFLGIVDHFVH